MKNLFLILFVSAILTNFIMKIDENSFEFVVNANPGNTINFIQLVYVSNGVTFIVMPVEKAEYFKAPEITPEVLKAYNAGQ